MNMTGGHRVELIHVVKLGLWVVPFTFRWTLGRSSGSLFSDPELPLGRIILRGVRRSFSFACISVLRPLFLRLRWFIGYVVGVNIDLQDHHWLGSILDWVSLVVLCDREYDEVLLDSHLGLDWLDIAEHREERVEVVLFFSVPFYLELRHHCLLFLPF